MKKNLVFVATLEDKGYVVILRRDKAYLKHLASRCMKQIDVKMKNLYLLQVEIGATLSCKVGSAPSRDVRVEESITLRESLE